MFDKNMRSFQCRTGRFDGVQMFLLEWNQQNISQTNVFEFLKLMGINEDLLLKLLVYLVDTITTYSISFVGFRYKSL